MCGLVGAIGTLTFKHEKFFKQALLCDTLRGAHATGVCVVKNREANTYKAAMPAQYFMDLKPADSLLDSITGARVAMGHNRYGTMGNNGNHKNAHPFHHDDIILMHNGTLTSHYSLTTERFTIDSEAICAAIAIDGAAEVIPKLQGAFALVWYDESDETLNFVRNEERELFFATTKLGTMMWASEKGMLKWLLSEERKIGIEYEEITKVPVGKWIKIPVNSLKDTEVIDVELYPKPSYRSPGYTNISYGRPANNASPRILVLNHLLEGTTLNVGDSIEAKETNSSLTVKKKYVVRGVYRYTGCNTLYVEVANDSGVPMSLRPTLFRRASSTIVPFTSKDASVVRFTKEAEVWGPSMNAIDLKKHIKFQVIDYMPYDKCDWGSISGISTLYPYAEVAVHGIDQATYDALMDGNLNKLLEAGLVAIKPPEVSLNTHSKWTDKEYASFILILKGLRSDALSLRKAQYDVDEDLLFLGDPIGPTEMYEIGLGTMVDAEEFKKVTNNLGCGNCNETEFDPKNAKDLEWIDSTTFWCGPCHSEELDRTAAL